MTFSIKNPPVRRILFLSLFFLLLGQAEHAFSDVKVPTLKIDLSESESPDEIVPAVKILLLLTVLSVAPAIVLMMTSFTRILIVLSFVRQALGSPTMPPNQVILGLSLFLTFFTMSPVIDQIRDQAYEPYIKKEISQEEALDTLILPVRKFLLSETREADLALFLNIAGLQKPQSEQDIPLSALIPAFMISELKTAFQMGFLVYIPFLIIDMVISSVLMAMGMMMLPPTVVSLPFKLVLFVLVDGWSLVVNSIVRSFNVF
jgi:flagellar biosynthetic protein FliP